MAELRQKVPTDPHEDRWSRMAVSSRKDDIRAAVDIDEKLEDYIGFSRNNMSVAGASFQNQAFREIGKHDDKLKSFNQRVLKEFEELKRTKYFANYHHRFPISNDPLTSGFVINPEQISPVLRSSEERIKALETEMDHRERDMLKMSGVVELLIEENKYLRDHISSKNRDINKILETIGLNDGETTHDLRHRLTLLSEENNILLGHLEELRAIKENFERFSREKNTEYSRSLEEYEQCRLSLEEALKREEVLTNYKQLMEPRFRQSQDKIAELESTIADLIQELGIIKNQNASLSTQLVSFKKNIDETSNKSTLEVDRLVQEVNALQNERKELKKLAETKEKVYEDKQNELKKVRRDFNQLQLEFEEVVQVMNELKNQLANERMTAEAAVKKEKELRERNNALANELDRAMGNIRSNEETHFQSVESFKIDYDLKISKIEQKNKKLKVKLEDKEKKYKAEIYALKAQTEDLAKILESVSAEREDYYKRYTELTKEQELYISREQTIIELENRYERLQKESDKYKTELADTERRYGTQADNLREESNRLNDINKQLIDEVCQLKKEIETLKTSKDTNVRNVSHETTKDNTVEVTRKTNEQGGSPSPDSKRRDYYELEKENQYLHQMIKNLVQNEDNQQPRRANNFSRNVEHRTNISPPRERYHSPPREIIRRPIPVVEHVVPIEHRVPVPVHMPPVMHVEAPISAHLPRHHIIEQHRTAASLSPLRRRPEVITDVVHPVIVDRPSHRDVTRHMYASASLSPTRGVDIDLRGSRIPHTNKVRGELSSSALRESYLEGLRQGIAARSGSPGKNIDVTSYIGTDKLVSGGSATDRPVGTTANLIRNSYLEKSAKAGTFSPPKKVEFRDNIDVSSYGRGAENVSMLRRDDIKLATPSIDQNISYQMRSSFNQRDSTNSRKKGDANVDQVIDGILKKYNMDKVPDYVGKGKAVGSVGETGALGRGSYDTTKNVAYTTTYAAADRGAGSFDPTKNVAYTTSYAAERGGETRGILKSPQMQFLSPLLSSPKYDSKPGSAINSVKKGELIGQIGTPDVKR